MKKYFKRVLAQLLVISMMMGQAVGVHALETEKVTNETIEETSTSYSESDSEIEPYAGEIEEPVFEAKLNELETEVVLTLKDYSKQPEQSVVFAVWSEHDGQDDICWLDTEEDNGVYEIRKSIGENEKPGAYKAEAYAISPNGEKTFIESTEFAIQETDSVNTQEVSTEVKFGTFNVNAVGNGKIEVNITGVQPQNKVKSVRAFVWTTADKSDGRWYEAFDNKEGSYHTVIDIGDFGYNMGSYNTEAHVILNDETEQLLGSSTVDVKVGAEKLGVETNKEGTKLEIRLEGLETQGRTDNLEAAVWSDEGWQDDLKWYSLSKEGDAYVCSVDLSLHKSVGIYYTDIYLKGDNGKRYILKSQKVSVEKVQPGILNIQQGENGHTHINLSNIVFEESIDKIEMKVWSANDESDICWYQAKQVGAGQYEVVTDLGNHQYNTGLYYADVYVTAKNGARYYLQGDTYKINILANKLELKVNTENTTIGAALYGLEDQSISKEVQFAVWSAENGQDDLKWYTAKQSGNEWKYNIDLKNHKSTGVYYVDAYVIDKNGKKHFVKSNVCTVSKIAKGTMKISEDGKGNIGVILTGIKNTEAIDKIEVAIWSHEGWQDDLKWYTAKNGSVGTYTVNTNLKNHKYSLGLYYADVYVTMKNGARYYLQGNTCKINISSDKLELKVNTENTTIGAALYGLEDQSISKEVQFAVWSAENGQDDLKWYTAKQSGNEWKYNIDLKNHKSTGVYYVDAYVIDKNGKKHFVKSNVCTVSKIAKGTMKISEDGKGNIGVILTGIKNTEAIDKIEVAIWSHEGWQDDLKWYTAKNGSVGTYTVNTNLKNHKYSLGLYYADVYVTMKNGARYCLQGTTQTIKITVSQLVEVPTSAKDMTHIKATGLVTHGVAEKVKVAVWSDKNGQDDLYWYDMDLVQGNYEAWINHYKHKDAGKYYADVYIQNPYGKMCFVKSMIFNVDTLPKDRIVVSNYQKNKGTFDVYVYVQNVANAIKSVKVPVWVSSDQSDIHWYQGIRQADGSYKVTVNVKNHKYHSGKYIIDSYVQDTAGLMIYIRNTSLEVTAPVVISKTIKDERECRITISGIDDRTVDEVYFPTWSVDKGQDDIIWYRGEHNSDGSWTAIVNTKNHKSLGEYITHIYTKKNGVDTYCGKPDNYTLTKRYEGTWQWIDGYKRYINMDGQIDNDVSRLVTGPYLIKVYKWSNYLIVFAKDEYGNYTVPVKAMITSCGNNTPTGTYYSPMKFRWLTMVGGSKAQWCTQISGDYLFHSVPYRVADPTTLYTDLMYNYLGTTQSLGCIRLQAGDAKWLYDNCDLGTEIYITPWESEGPIAKPAFSPIPSWHTWDPTDPTVRYLCEERGCH